jgi:hypothetical protein
MAVAVLMPISLTPVVALMVLITPAKMMKLEC